MNLSPVEAINRTNESQSGAVKLSRLAHFNMPQLTTLPEAMEFSRVDIH